MQMHIDQRELPATIDAVEFALNQIYHDIESGSLHDGPIAKRTIEQLQMLRLALMLGAAKEQREGARCPTHGVTLSNIHGCTLCTAAAKEQRKDRANDSPPSTDWKPANSFHRNGPHDG